MDVHLNEFAALSRANDSTGTLSRFHFSNGAPALILSLFLSRFRCHLGPLARPSVLTPFAHVQRRHLREYKEQQPPPKCEEGNGIKGNKGAKGGVKETISSQEVIRKYHVLQKKLAQVCG